jgi:FAD/FMN-containing dehydrogenase
MSLTTSEQFLAPSGLTDRVLEPSDEGFLDACTPWNLAVQQRPVAVARPHSDTELAAIVAAAGEQGLRVTAQGTGHGAAPLGTLEDTLLLRTELMRGVSIDPLARTARVQAGAVWGDVTDAAAQHGLSALAGSARDVGVVGYTLGGGLSWLARRYGLAVNHVLEAEVVTPAGEIVRASARENADLFYALRGGGGSFGVVSALEFQLFELPDVFAGMLLFPLGRAEEVLNSFARWSASVPDTVTSLGRLLNLPPLPDIPERLRGRSFVGIEAVVLQQEEQAARLLEPLRKLGAEIDTFAMTPTSALGRLHMDPPGPVAGVGDSTMLEVLSEATVEALVLAAGEHSGSPLLSVELRHLGGAVARTPQGAGALGGLDGAFCVFAVGMAVTPEMAATADAHLCLVMDALAPWSTPRRYLNFADRHGEDPSRMFTPGDYERLRTLKAQLDPLNVFRANHEIAALGEGAPRS